MPDLAKEIIEAEVLKDSVQIWWLAQAGFVFKTAAGRVIYVDPYLSDAVERLYDFKRMSIAPIDAKDVKADIVINTHEHADHFDPDAMPVIAENNPKCHFAGSLSCKELYESSGIDSDRYTMLEVDKTYSFDDVTVYTCKADHGDYAPTAVGLLLDFDGVRVFYTGDTALRPGLFEKFCEMKPDILLPCINGNFGNMNHIDAAMLAQQVKPKLVIPCHFWMFIEHGGDPASFLYACKHFCPEVSAMILKPGEGLLFQKQTT